MSPKTQSTGNNNNEKYLKLSQDLIAVDYLDPSSDSKVAIVRPNHSLLIYSSIQKL